MVDMTTAGLDDTTVVTATLLGLLAAAGKTTVCLWLAAVSMDVDTSLESAAELALLPWEWDLDRMLGTKLELGEVVTMIT